MFCMKELFISYGFNLSEEQLSKFDRYFHILTEVNEKFNLTAITEKREVYIKHFIDSILPVKMLNSEKVIDVGTGGGFPGVPLKILFPNIKLTLLEATQKKCAYLEYLCSELNIDAEIICGRAEDLGQNDKYREKFDLCVSRAVARLNILSEYCIPFVKLNGKFIAYKGVYGEEEKEGEKAVLKLGGSINDIYKYNLDGAERCAVIINKISKTPPTFPRINAKIRKKPL